MNNLLIISFVFLFHCTQIVAQTTKVETGSKNTNKIIKDLEGLASQFGSESEAFLDYWQRHYHLMSDTTEIKKIWQFLIKTRVKEFGENSNAHISALFGLSSFYKRYNMEDQYQALKKQVEVYWKEAHDGEVAKTPEEKEEPEKEPEEMCCGCMPELPRFPGCEAREGDSKVKKNCADQKLLNFIYSTIRYPKEARENDIEGMVVVGFTVTEYGTITNIKIMKNLSGGCEEEALRIINLMNELPNRLIPAKQKDEKIRVKWNLPVRFKLN